MRNAGLDEAQAGMKIAERNTNNLRWRHPYCRKWRRTKEPLDESERGEWKSWLKAHHTENEDMASGPITSWQINGETVETVSDFILGSSKIIAVGDCSHEIKRRLLLGRKVMTDLDSILKSRDYFANKGPSSQGYGFSSSHVWMWELDYKESWVPKNWCFWTVMLKKTFLRVPGSQGDPTSPL